MPVAESFAAIVALIGQFRSEKASQEQAGFGEFMEWLTKINHEEIKELLLLNTKATIGIKAILNQDRNIVLDQLQRIDGALASFSSKFEGFSDLATALKPSSSLSKQAISILVQFEKSKASKALEMKILGGCLYQFLDGEGGQIDIDEQRFVEDDFKTLVELGLLRHDYNSKGSNLYIFTRQGASLVSELSL
jgi:hypothetical protein